MTDFSIPSARPASLSWMRYLPLDRADYAVIAVCLAYAAAAALALSITGAEKASSFGAYLGIWPFVFFVLFPAIFGLVVAVRIIHRLDGRHARLMAARRALNVRYLRPFASGLVLLGFMMLFQGAFTSIKTALPIWNGGFEYDRIQADIDAALHFGVDPWRWLYAVGAYPWVRAVVEWNYNQGWFILCYAALFFVAVSARCQAIRTRYFLTYMIVWIVVGNVLAELFLSAGPAFYAQVTGDAARFGQQTAFLAGGAEGTHSAIRYQTYLWNLYSGDHSGLGSGISAFPSMHVSLVTLNALFVAEASRRWGVAAFAYVAVILASSVYLGWHYAIDGYAGIAVTSATYWLMRKLPAFKAS